MTSNYDLHDDHLRYLLDQRAARADLHGRFPSQSDFSDSPSLYSHAHFSPKSFNRQDAETSSSSFHYTVSSHHRMPSTSTELRSPVSDRERLNFPDESSLDLDDDSRSSSFDHTHASGNNDPDSGEDEVADDDTEEHRVSAYGPKMRFHSRAPWEMSEEEEEPLGEQSSSKKRGGNKTRKVDPPKKPWGLGKHGSEARPSIESTRSQGKAKQSFDTVSSFSSNGGALLALAQASMSSTSLALTPSPQSSLRDKLALPRLRSRTTSSAKNPGKLEPIDTLSATPNVSSPSVHTSPMTRFRPASPSESVFSHVDPRSSLSGPPSPHTPQHFEYKHPYANPELTRQFASDTPPPPSQQLEELHALAHSPSYSVMASRSNSYVTLTDSNTTSSMSQSGSDTTVTLTPVTSMSSMQTKSDSFTSPRFLGMQGKGISAPLLVNKAAVRSLPPNMPSGAGSYITTSSSKRETKFISAMPIGGLSAWNDSPGTASIKLISLEEAQAQARERSRSATASAVASPGGFTRVHEVEPLPSPTSQTSTGWARMRSTSAGSSRAKASLSSSGVDLHHPVPPLPVDTAHQPMEQGSNGAGSQKTIVRKKSGFMRLFNGKERPAPPPVPVHTTNPIPTALPSPPPVSTSRKGSTHRVPVPSITPSLLQAPDSAGSGLSSFDTRSDKDSLSPASATRETQLNTRRNLPGLSIVTSSPSTSSLISISHHRSASPGASDSTHASSTTTVMTPTTAASTDISSYKSVPNSAPPNSADFLGLSLRPVSTMFSTNFSEHLATRDRYSADQPRPSLDSDSGTPTTCTTIISPLSPAFPIRLDSRSNEEKPLPVGIAAQQEDQSAVIQALQEQIMTARRAWQRQIWELEGQVRDLKAEVDELQAADDAKEYCAACGRGSVGRPGVEREIHPDDLRKAGVKVGGVVNRPRAPTGVGSRFASGT